MFVVVVSILAVSMQSAVAIRQTPESFDGESYLSFPTTAFETARETMSSWMARLPAGPSPRGAGH